jgi:hypothetical protein
MLCVVIDLVPNNSVDLVDLKVRHKH